MRNIFQSPWKQPVSGRKSHSHTNQSPLWPPWWQITLQLVLQNGRLAHSASPYSSVWNIYIVLRLGYCPSFWPAINTDMRNVFMSTKQSVCGHYNFLILCEETKMIKTSVQMAHFIIMIHITLNYRTYFASSFFYFPKAQQKFSSAYKKIFIIIHDQVERVICFILWHVLPIDESSNEKT